MNVYSENTLVQKALREQLAKLDWEVVNGGDADALAALGRMSEEEMFLRGPLEDALRRLNPWLTTPLLKETIGKLTAPIGLSGLLETNAERYAWALHGVEVKFRDTKKGWEETRRVKVFDFDKPEANRFVAVYECRIRSGAFLRRADVIGFVNGLPLLFVELKAPGVALREAFDKNYQDYQREMPALFANNAFVVFSNGAQSKVGALGADYAFFHEWKRLEERDGAGSTALARLAEGMFAKDRFMDLFENFILFERSPAGLTKIVARNHQALGVNKAFEAYRRRETLGGKLGVFWHTQGSGKSYSMVFLARKILRKLSGTPTVLVLVDREELQEQLSATFEQCGVCERAQSLATSEVDLYEKLESKAKVVFALIQKFQGRHAPVPGSEEVVLFSDEAHRSQYGIYAENLAEALPNAVRLGFTGTPLLGSDQLTRRTFGEYVSIYDFQRAVADGATLPLYYEPRGKALHVEHDEELNRKIAEAIDEAEPDDVQREKLERRFRKSYHVLTAKERLQAIAEDLAAHFAARWRCGKAMVVCLDKLTCVKLYNYVHEAWERLMAAETDPEKRAWMEATDMAVVVSAAQGEETVFEKHGLDIRPHRIRMEQERLDKKFKNRSDPLRLVFVCAMWLTGFDVKPLSCLYLDKPLKAHTLMQTIARVNRVDANKVGGLVVDYIGIVDALRKALADYTNVEGAAGQDPFQDLDTLVARFREALDEATRRLTEGGFAIERLFGELTATERLQALADAAEAVSQSAESKATYLAAVRLLNRTATLIGREKLTEEEIDAREAHRAIVTFFEDRRREADVTDLAAAIQRIVDDYIHIEADADKAVAEPLDLSDIDFSRLADAFRRSSHKRQIIEETLERVKAKAAKLAQKNPTRTDFLKAYEAIAEAYNACQDPEAAEQLFLKLIALSNELTEEQDRYLREGFESEEELAVYDVIRSGVSLSKEDIEKAKQVAKQILEAVRNVLDKPDFWASESASSKLDIDIRDLLDTLPYSFSDEVIADRREALLTHFRDVWETLRPAS